MSDIFQLVKDGHVFGFIIPAEDAKLNMIATSEIAVVSVKLLLDDSLKGQELTLTGPDSLDAHTAAEIITKVTTDLSSLHWGLPQTSSGKHC